VSGVRRPASSVSVQRSGARPPAIPPAASVASSPAIPPVIPLAVTAAHLPPILPAALLPIAPERGLSVLEDGTSCSLQRPAAFSVLLRPAIHRYLPSRSRCCSPLSSAASIPRASTPRRAHTHGEQSPSRPYSWLAPPTAFILMASTVFCCVHIDGQHKLRVVANTRRLVHEKQDMHNGTPVFWLHDRWITPARKSPTVWVAG